MIENFYQNRGKSMKKKKEKSLFLWISIVISVVAFYLIIAQSFRNTNIINFMFNTQQRTNTENNLSNEPRDVVKQYFGSWKEKNWPRMYETISDGFKKIDSSAKDLTTFSNFANSQGIEDVKIINIEEESNDGTYAVVAYSVEFTLSDGSKQNFSDKFSLKFRQNDNMPGWKLIHPYGPNVDTS